MLHCIALCIRHARCEILKILSVFFAALVRLGIAILIVFVGVGKCFFKVVDIIDLVKPDCALARPC